MKAGQKKSNNFFGFEPFQAVSLFAFIIIMLTLVLIIFQLDTYSTRLALLEETTYETNVDVTGNASNDTLNSLPLTGSNGGYCSYKFGGLMRKTWCSTCGEAGYNCTDIRVGHLNYKLALKCSETGSNYDCSSVRILSSAFSWN